MSDKKFIVTIDPGHGVISTDLGADGGAAYEEEEITIRKEADDVRILAKLVHQKLLQTGMVDSRLWKDGEWYEPGVTKDQDKANRRAWSVNINPHFALSIHRNAGSGEGVAGFVHNKFHLIHTEKASNVGEVGISGSKVIELSKVLSEEISNVSGLKVHIGGTGFGYGGDPNNEDYYWTPLSNHPAILLEVGFIDNQNDNEIFDEFTDEIAEAICQTILEHLLQWYEDDDNDNENPPVGGGFADGEGTQSNPYIIRQPDHLGYLAQSVNEGESYSGKYIKLDNDLDLSGFSWTPIGTSESALVSRPFSGTFVGGGNTIKNLTAGSAGSNYTGLFGYARNAVIEDVCLENANVTGAGYVGGLVGCAENTRIADVAVSESSVSGSEHVGGVIGSTSGSGSVNHCTFSGSVTASDSQGGGIAGNANVTVENCINWGSIEGLSSLGGIIGRMDTDSSKSILTCANFGPVSRIGSRSTYSTGGIAGYIGCQSSNPFVTVKDCCNSAPITGYSLCGGIVGSVQSGLVLMNVYNTHQVIGDNMVGGLVGGFNSTVGAYTGALAQAYTTGLVAGSSSVGQVVGHNAATSILNTYYTGSDRAALGGGTTSGRNYALTSTTPDALKAKPAGLGDGFVLDTEGKNDGYPLLAAIEGLLATEPPEVPEPARNLTRQTLKNFRNFRYAQRDEKWVNVATGFADWGCAVCCASAISDYVENYASPIFAYGPAYPEDHPQIRIYNDPEVMKFREVFSDANRDCQWNKASNLAIYSDQKRAGDLPGALATIKAYVDVGIPVLIKLQGMISGSLTTHFVVAYDYTENCTASQHVKVVDPEATDYRTLQDCYNTWSTFLGIRTIFVPHAEKGVMPTVLDTDSDDGYLLGYGIEGSYIRAVLSDGTQIMTTVAPGGSWAVEANGYLYGNVISMASQIELGKSESDAYCGSNRDLTPPPVINDSYNGDTRISGTGIASSTIVAWKESNKNDAYKTTVNEDGTWHITFSSPLTLNDWICAKQVRPRYIASGIAYSKVL